MQRYKTSAKSEKPTGFTLVELLVVITIIGILIALLLPAVQAAREAARRAQCVNNLKQLGLASHNHISTFNRFPTGGWGYTWIGNPDCGTNWQQPGGLFYNLLPYMEQQALHDLGVGSATTTAGTTLITTPISALYCPSRRASINYPLLSISGSGVNNHLSFYYGNATTTLTVTPSPATVTRGDYAGNSGDCYTDNYLPTSYSTGISSGPSSLVTFAKSASGVFYPGSSLDVAQIKDGLSNTYLIGEKYMCPDYYTTGQDYGDNECVFIGSDPDTVRWAGGMNSNAADTVVGPYTPYQDQSGFYSVATYVVFGSAHAAGFNMAMCDGSVRTISYSIDLTVHGYLGNRKDGHAIDGSKL
jgi:prepilin-type N-terminal cleavage/methylation domain-containing protein/prepilin-type processing-associated H-X9-DG protein